MNTPTEHMCARGRALLAAATACAVLAACGGSSGEDSAAVAKSAPARSTAGATSTKLAPTLTGTSTVTVAAAPAAATATASSEGRLLASNCFQCHGTNGTGGFDSIRGGEAEEIKEFLTKAANRDIMAAHAQGYTPAQLQKVIAYLQQ